MRKLDSKTKKMIVAGRFCIFNVYGVGVFCWD